LIIAILLEFPFPVAHASGGSQQTAGTVTLGRQPEPKSIA
jgi:hypothetical protein